MYVCVWREVEVEVGVGFVYGGGKTRLWCEKQVFVLGNSLDTEKSLC